MAVSSLEKTDQESFDYLVPDILMPEIRRRHQNSNLVESLSMNLRNQRLLEVLPNLLAATHFRANALSVQEVQMLSLVYPHRRRMDPFVVLNDRNMVERGHLADNGHSLADTALKQDLTERLGVESRDSLLKARAQAFARAQK